MGVLDVRRLGRGIATGFAEAGAPVVAVARSAAALAELEAAHEGIEREVADATDASVAATVLSRCSAGSPRP